MRSPVQRGVARRWAGGCGALAVVVTACGGASQEGVESTSTTPQVADSVAEEPDQSLPNVVDASEPPATTEETGPEDAEPKETEPEETSPEETSVPSEPVPGSPPIDEALVERIPPLDGYDYGPPAAFWWSHLNLPEDVTTAPRAIIADGPALGTVVAVESTSTVPLIDRYVDEVFAEQVQLVADSDTMDDGSVVYVTNSARAEWQGIDGIPVITASANRERRWAWTHDDLLWIVDGAAELETFVRRLIGDQQAAAPSEPFDFHGLYGAVLASWLPPVDGYRYTDLPRTDVLPSFEQSPVRPCAQQYWLGYIPAPDDPQPEIYEDRKLTLDVAMVSDVCVEDGYMDDVRASIGGGGYEPATLGVADAYRDEDEIIYVVEGVVYHFVSSDPATLDMMQPFITGLLGTVATATGTAGTTTTTAPATTASPPPTVAAPTGTTLPSGARELFGFETFRTGQCIWRAPAIPGQDDLQRRSFEVDCSLPHQVEAIDNAVIDGAPGAPFPGDAAVEAQAHAGCAVAFGDYVGVPFEASRLNYFVFYPSAFTWDQGDRGHCFLVGAYLDEEFTRLMAGSGE